MRMLPLGGRGVVLPLGGRGVVGVGSPLGAGGLLLGQGWEEEEGGGQY